MKQEMKLQKKDEDICGFGELLITLIVGFSLTLIIKLSAYNCNGQLSVRQKQINIFFLSRYENIDYIYKYRSCMHADYMFMLLKLTNIIVLAFFIQMAIS